MSASTTAEGKPLRNLLTEAMGTFAERSPEVAARIAALADEGWLEDHQTSGSLKQVAQELLNAAQGVPTTDAD